MSKCDSIAPDAAQEMKVVARAQEGGERRKNKGRGRSGGSWKGMQAREGASERLSSISPGLAGADGKLEGKVHSADCLVGQGIGGQVAMPMIASHPSQV